MKDLDKKSDANFKKRRLEKKKKHKVENKKTIKECKLENVESYTKVIAGISLKRDSSSKARWNTNIFITKGFVLATILKRKCAVIEKNYPSKTIVVMQNITKYAAKNRGICRVSIVACVKHQDLFKSKDRCLLLL